MSAFVYGRMMARHARAEQRWRELGVDGQAGKPAPKAPDPFITSVAALIPADIIAAHAFVLTQTTRTDEAGATTITDPTLLQWSLIGLLGATVVVYLLGRGINGWVPPADLVRLTIPALAFLAWTALIGTSALSPWVAGIAKAPVVVIAIVGAVVLLAINRAVTPESS